MSILTDFEAALNNYVDPQYSDMDRLYDWKLCLEKALKDHIQWLHDSSREARGFSGHHQDEFSGMSAAYNQAKHRLLKLFPELAPK